MSLLDHPNEIGAPNIQVWNNAAFDNGESDITTLSWSNLKDSCKNPSSESFPIDCSKENLCPLSFKTPVSVKYSVSVNPLNRNGVLENSQGTPLKTPCIISAKRYGIKEERNIDEEIEETEREITRLSTRLKALQIEKAEHNATRTTIQRGGRFVPIKSIAPKVENGSVGSKMGQNRGLSLGPSEIYAGVGVRREVTPAVGNVRRRQSCLPKLLDIDEEKRKNSMSLRTARQAATTIVSKRPAKKDGVFELIQPKKLFNDGEKSAPPMSTKKPLKAGRIVASRYNQTNESSQVTTENRKRSLPGNCKDDGGSRYDKRRSSSEICRSKAAQSRVKKRWEIPMVGDMLPRIKTTRCVNMSPRDSGPAKRVAELIESKTNFFADEIEEALICQKLNFAEDEDEDEE